MPIKLKYAGGLYHSALVANLWEDIMHNAGWREYCVSTTQFQWVTYAYTKDAPLICIQQGEGLWKILIDALGDEGTGGVITVGQGPITTVTRRAELWDK